MANVFEKIGISPATAALTAGGLFAGYKVLQKFGLVKSEESVKEAGVLAAPYLSPRYTTELKSKGKKWKAWSNDTTPKDIATRIHDAKGFFNDNEEKLWGALKRIMFKSQAGVVSYWFTQLYGVDLAEYLNGFLNKAEMARVYDYFEKLESGIV